MIKFTRLILAALLISAATGSAVVFAAEEKPADKAVAEYLRLRRAGKRHYEALSKVRAEFGLSDAEINQAANQIGSNGYPTDALPADAATAVPNQRGPSGVNTYKRALPQ